ncbi:MAG: Cell division protein FtsL [Desulfotomaculum sp. 46_80]|nr:MAG: Cell division protein FtsL [Desulfotomaculum sp. 46_80]
MVAVQEQSKYTSLPERLNKPARQSRNEFLSRRQKLVIVGLVLSVFIAGIFVVFLYAQMVNTGYQIYKLRMQTASLDMQVKDLSEELERFSSLDKIEMVATTKLGMVRPDLNKLVIIQTEPAEKATLTNETSPPAEKKSLADAADINNNWVIQALVNLVANKSDTNLRRQAS